MDACESITQTLKMLINPKMLLMVPLLASFALVITFMVVDISKAYLACAYGIHHVGYFFVAWGISSSLFSVVVKYVIKLLGRYVTLSFAIFSQVVLSLYLWLIWNANDSFHFYSLFVLAVWLGIVESIVYVISNSKFTNHVSIRRIKKLMDFRNLSNHRHNFRAK